MARKTIKIEEVRTAVANYMRHVGCGCCRDHAAHDKAREILAELLNVPMYDDESGYDFGQFESEK